MKALHLPRKAIDSRAWDETIMGAKLPLPYALSWYLDITTGKKWSGLVNGNYDSVMPLPSPVKGILMQPAFSQQLGIFGANLTPGIVQNFVKAIPSPIVFARLHFNEYCTPFLTKSSFFARRANLILPLKPPYHEIRQAYHPSLKRQLNKTQGKLNLENSHNYPAFLEFYLRNNSKKFSLSSGQKRKLGKLCEAMIRRSCAQIFQVKDSRGEIVAMDLVWTGASRLIHLFPASSSEGRQAGAMHFLIDALIRQYAERQVVFDFEGSLIPGIARFYRTFGAKEAYFPVYYRNFFQLRAKNNAL